MSESMREIVLDILNAIAPEADLVELDPTADMRDELEIDSLDLLNFAIAVEERTGIDIPESDYARIATLETCVSYLDARAADAN